MILVFALAVSEIRFGWRGIIGMTVGVIASWLHLWLLWRVISVLGESSKSQSVVSQGTPIVLLCFVIQLPAFVLLGIEIPKLGEGALSCFVTGLGMVYCGAVAWGVART
ncbi:MAG: hypothetical protein P4L46_17820 [Fimbriimonas sp.]|nr:hypothetical protein [Fimbriimonas sp.]